MQYYQTKAEKNIGSNFKELRKKAEKIYFQIKKRSRRKPYIRSTYFNGSKVFIDYFWEHLHSKNLRDKQRRLMVYAAALEVIKNSNIHPEAVENPNKKRELLYRFKGKTKDGILFTVQIKEDKKSGAKYFISVFPE